MRGSAYGVEHCSRPVYPVHAIGTWFTARWDIPNLNLESPGHGPTMATIRGTGKVDRPIRRPEHLLIRYRIEVFDKAFPAEL